MASPDNDKPTSESEESVVPQLVSETQQISPNKLKELNPDFALKTPEEIKDWITSRTGTLTADWIKSRIASVEYFALPNGRSTICTIELDNKCIMVGESHVLSPENYNEDIGKTISYNNAFDKLWEVFGFSRRELNFFINEGNPVSVK